MEEKKLEITIKATISNDEPLSFITSYDHIHRFERELFREIENHFLNSMRDWLTIVDLEITSSSGRRLKKEESD